MTEKREEKCERKVVSRNITIILGTVCVILAIGLVGAIATYTSVISEKDNRIFTKLSNSFIEFSNN